MKKSRSNRIESRSDGITRQILRL